MSRALSYLLYCLSGVLLLISCNRNGEDPLDELRSGFMDPPVRARPAAYMDFVDGNFQLEEITREMEEAKRMGMGGFDIWDVSSRVDEDSIMPSGPAFMSDSSVEAIVYAIGEAERIGLDLGLVIASGWNAGGPWTLPEHQTMGLFSALTTVQGPAELQVELPFPELPDKQEKDSRGKPISIPRGADGLPLFYTDVAVLAWQENEAGEIDGRVLDLTGSVDSTGVLSWDVPEGRWHVTRYVCTNTGETMFSSTPNSIGPMIDHFNPEAAERHIRYFIDRIEARLGKPLKGSGLKYFYTDSYEVRGRLWTPAMAEEFESRKGYSLIPFLPALDGKTVVDQDSTRRFMYDYNNLLSDLITEYHYETIRKICEEHGVAFSAEAAGPGPPLHNCPFESLRSSGVLSFPRGEFWHIPSNNAHWERQMPPARRHHYLVENQVVKGVASASHIYDRKFVEAEAFTGVHLWNEGPGDLKPTADRAFCEGLNRIIYHTWPHTPEEAGTPGWIYSFGTLVNEHRIWWPMAKPWNDYLGRCSYLLQEGLFQGDLLIFYGDSAPNFVPAKDIFPGLGFGYEYDYCNADILLNRLQVEDGKLVLPHGQSYEVLVLPEVESMQPEIISKLDSLLDAGATIVGPKPLRSNGLYRWEEHDREVRELTAELWGAGPGKVIEGISLRDVLLSRGVGPDFDFEGDAPNTSLDFIHRKIGDTDVYFVRNSLDRSVHGKAFFRQTGKQAEYWDPASGNMYKANDLEPGSGGTRLDLSLDPFGAIFVVFSPSMETESFLVEGSPALGAFLDTNLEEVSLLEGPWDVYFPEEQAGPGLVQFQELMFWNRHPRDEVRFFSGIASYDCEFDWEGTTDGVYLELEKVVEMARIYLNGEEMGIAWTPPFRLEISRALRKGSNALRIEVANTWHNGLAWDRKLPPEQRRTKSNITRLPNAWTFPMEDIPNEEYDLIDGGLEGQVRLLQINTLKP